jgi:hypothetical protein
MSDPIAEGNESPADAATVVRDDAVVNALAISRREGQSMLERWVEDDNELAIKRVETMVDILGRLRTLSIRATYPSDWLIHVSRDDQGNVLREVGYLQDVGAERAAKPWGIEVRSPIWQREPTNDFFTDNTFIYHCEAEAFCKLTGERAEVRGSKWSGEPFFARRAEAGPNGQVDPTDVSKAAYTNLHGRAVRALAGLNAVPVDRLEAAGLDLAKVVRIGYAKGAQGGQSTGAAMGGGELLIAWGNAKGKKLTELEVRDLEYYLQAYERDVVDPTKARFKKANERMLEGLKAEAERRVRQREQQEAPPGQMQL